MRIHWLMVSCSLLLLSGCYQDENRFQGYNEAQFTYIASDSSGKIKQLVVHKGQYVIAGEKLVVLEAQPESDELERARSEATAAVAEKKSSSAALALAKLNLNRNQNLLKNHAIDQSEFDRIQADFINAEAQDEKMAAELAAAKAAVEKFTWRSKQKDLPAPKNSVVFDTFYVEGEFVKAGQPIVALLSPQQVKTIFYVSELQLNQFKLGDAVAIHCDGCQTSHAKISYISPQAEYTPPVIYSEQTRSSLVFRIEATPTQQAGLSLKPGQPVTISLMHSS